MTISKVSALCHLLEGYLSAVPESEKDGHRIERLFLYACIWAFGGCAAADKTSDSRQLFNEVWRDVAKGGLKLPKVVCVLNTPWIRSLATPANGPNCTPSCEPVGAGEVLEYCRGYR